MIFATAPVIAEQTGMMHRHIPVPSRKTPALPRTSAGCERSELTVRNLSRPSITDGKVTSPSENSPSAAKTYTAVSRKIITPPAYSAVLRRNTFVLLNVTASVQLTARQCTDNAIMTEPRYQ